MSVKLFQWLKKDFDHTKAIDIEAPYPLFVCVCVCVCFFFFFACQKFRKVGHPPPLTKIPGSAPVRDLSLATKIIQLLTGFEGNRWSVGPEDELLPEAEGRGQQFIWGANRSSVARKHRQQLFCYTPFSWIMFNDERTGTRQNDQLHNIKT